MIWVLGTSLAANVVLLVAWLKTLVDARDWKEIARESFERDADDVIRRQSIGGQSGGAPLGNWYRCSVCNNLHPIGTKCSFIERQVN